MPPGENASPAHLDRDDRSPESRPPRWRRQRSIAEVLVDAFIRDGVVRLATTPDISDRRFNRALVALLFLACLSAALIAVALAKTPSVLADRWTDLRTPPAHYVIAEFKDQCTSLAIGY
jgi:hypothetical protein